MACAVMLSTALRINREVREKELATIARYVFDVPPSVPDCEAVDLLIERMETLGRRVGVPSRLADLGIRHDQIPSIVKSSRGQSMSGNPCDVSDAQLSRLLEKML
jgi:alcohol dehydrogenase class IV